MTLNIIEECPDMKYIFSIFTLKYVVQEYNMVRYELFPSKLMLPVSYLYGGWPVKGKQCNSALYGSVGGCVNSKQSVSQSQNCVKGSSCWPNILRTLMASTKSSILK